MLLALLGIAALTFLYSKRIASEMRDFEVFWTAGSRAAASEPLYRADDGHYQFKYLPAFAVTTAPLSLLPLRTAKAVWFSVSVALLFILLILSLSLLDERRRPAWFLAGVMVVTMAKFYGHELVLGQVNFLFATLVIVAILALRRQRPHLAGAVLVSAAIAKPYGVLFLPWVVAIGGLAATAGAAVLAAYAVLAPVALYGVHGTLTLHQEWWNTVATSTAPNLTNPDNVSVAGLAAKWFGDAGTIPAAIVSVALLGTATLVVLRGRTLAKRETLEGVLLLTLVPLLSPQGWDYVFLVSTPAIGIIANYDDRLPGWLRVAAWLALAAIGLSIYDVLGRELYARFMALSIVTLCYLIVVGTLTTLRLRRVI